MGPIVCNGLKRDYPDKVICQGVGQPYTAGLADNVSSSGTSQAAIGEATKMFTQANSKCPESIIVFGGYRYVFVKSFQKTSTTLAVMFWADNLSSQGTAVMMNAVQRLPANIKAKTVGGVLFGYTKNAQTKGSIPNYPSDRLQVFCNPTAGSPGKFSDGVCGGALNVNGGHFAYMGNGDGPKAIAFLKSKIDAALAGKGGA
jgi:cutinase